MQGTVDGLEGSDGFMVRILKNGVSGSCFRPGAAAVLSVTASGRVSPLATLGAAQRLACGGVLPKLERVGWVLPQGRGPHMLTECARGIEDPESETEPASEATTTLGGGSGSGASGADSNHTRYAEMTAEVSALRAFKLPFAPAFMFNQDLLHTAISLVRPELPLSVANTPLLRTAARTPIPSRATTQVPVSLKKPKKMPPPPRERKLTDEWTLSMHWPVGHA